MEKYIPYEKMSKKMQKAYNARKRGGWGEVNPVTRRSDRPGAYDRNAEKRKTRKWSEDSSTVSFLLKNTAVNKIGLIPLLEQRVRPI